MVLLKIKKVTLKDLKQIAYLEKKVFKENAFSEDLIINLIKNKALFLKLQKGKIIKNVIGFIVVIKDQNDRANIINFLIESKYQNRGYGSFLLQNVIDKIKAIKGINKIILNVQVSNSSAIRLYEKFNFKKNPAILENYYQSGESAFLMELKLESP